MNAEPSQITAADDVQEEQELVVVDTTRTPFAEEKTRTRRLRR